MEEHEVRESRSLKVHLRGDDSDGLLGVIEYPLSAGEDGPPLHVHPAHGEGFYVLDGEVTFQLRDELTTARAGSLAFATPGTPHTFANRSGHEARLLVFFSPAGFERYLERRAAGEAGDPAPGSALAVGPSIGAASEKRKEG